MARDRAPCAAASGGHYSTFCTMVGTYRHCTQAFVVKKQKNKKPCRSAKTKLTCDLWYQARSKAGMTGGEQIGPVKSPPLENTDSDVY